jgi:hypothetical protein
MKARRLFKARPAGLAVLGLLAAALATGPAAAGEPPHARGGAKPAAVNLAPLRQRAVSTAVGVGGDALATAANQSLAPQTGEPRSRLARSPAVQTAVSAAVSVGGNSAALAANNGAALSSGGIGLAPRPARPITQLGRAPPTSTAVSTAVTIGGVTIPTER